MQENPHFEKDHEWFEQNLPDLLKSHRGEHIAVIGGAHR